MSFSALSNTFLVVSSGPPGRVLHGFLMSTILSKRGVSAYFILDYYHSLFHDHSQYLFISIVRRINFLSLRTTIEGLLLTSPLGALLNYLYYVIDASSSLRPDKRQRKDTSGSKYDTNTSDAIRWEDLKPFICVRKKENMDLNRIVDYLKAAGEIKYTDTRRLVNVFRKYVCYFPTKLMRTACVMAQQTTTPKLEQVPGSIPSI